MGKKPPVDLVQTVLAAGGSLLQLPTAQAGWRDIPNPSQWEVVTKQMCHPVQRWIFYEGIDLSACTHYTVPEEALNGCEGRLALPQPVAHGDGGGHGTHLGPGDSSAADAITRHL